VLEEKISRRRNNLMQLTDFRGGRSAAVELKEVIYFEKNFSRFQLFCEK